MRSWWLALKIAAVFVFVMGVFIALTLHLFASRVMRSELSGAEAHHAFVVQTLQLFAVALVVMVGFAFWVTRPLRRMSRSMDRIAAGDLEHRVVVRGRDETAAMGRSFNAMAERVRAMVVGQKELMAGVSHELRSPLTRMKVSLELLRQGRGDTDARIADLEADVDALDGMVEELLLASRIDLGAASPERERLALEPLCREAWRRVARDADEKSIRLQLDLAADAREIEADRALCVRLFGNLFENSVRYAGEGTIFVRALRDGGRVRVTVRDEGPGVDPEVLVHLFEPFFRADRSRSRKTGAGGLGLMIVRRCVEAHDGDVAARNAEGRGLEIVFDLPA